MENFIIIAVIAIVFVIGIYSTAKHFRGKGGCCGSSDYTPKKKKLSNVLYQKTFQIEGMSYAHCFLTAS